MAARWLGGTDCAEDLVQDAMLKLWAMCAELHSPMAPLARVLVHNLCIDYLRRHHYTLSIDTTDVPDLSNASADIERIERMMAIVGTLPPAQQIILRLRHIDGMSAIDMPTIWRRRNIDGMSMADIARLTGGTEAAVRKALSRARMAVKEQYLHNM